MTTEARRTRVGWGFDAHRLGGDPPLLLGGVRVSEESGIIATSDGDVLAHAVTDALLGACVLGDMGDWFPADDPAYHRADSMGLLRQVVSAAAEAGWRPTHVDTTVIVEKVRVSPHRTGIRQGLAAALGIPPELVSVKATTTDGLGVLGEGRGIAAIAVIDVEPVT
jgi:2-C-methyl-D-erythritol 2,4-cyclodiphosphate synthase